MRRCLIVALVTLGGGSSFAQNPQLLADDPAMRWDAAKNGPMLVVSPERTVAVAEGGGLAAFARKRVTVRGITAIVPTRMTLVAERPPEGSLVEGLPRNIKVLYLLTKLTPGQWSSISTRGIGRDDLQGEARAVFDSLVPNPFGWQRYRVTTQRRNGINFSDEDRGVLSDAERQKVRLRINQSLSLRVSSIERPNVQAIFRTDREYGRPGEIGYQRDETFERQRSEAFGVALRTEVDNRTKPSHLAYRDASLDAPVSLSSPITVDGLLERIQTVTGKELVADLRVRDRNVTLVGTQARAGDLLEALALALTGTFRRVQDTYVLTSDLDGMGARKLRLGLWSADLSERAAEIQKRLTVELGAKDVRSKVAFDAKDPLTPNEAVRERVRTTGGLVMSEPFDANELGTELLEFLKRSTSQPGRWQSYDLSRVQVSASIEYRFVLPNGTPLHPEAGDLGDARRFAPGFDVAPGPNAGPERPWSPGVKDRLVVRVERADEARQAAEVAKAKGFGELWLETSSAEALRAGMEGGLPVRLALSPWAAAGKAPSDMNQLGETRPEIRQRAARLSSWNTLIQGNPEYQISDRPAFIPGSRAQTAAWEAYAKLAQTPGLAGVVVLSPQLAGYSERRRVAAFRSFQEIMEAEGLGYNPEMRQRFLREKRIDPIDIASMGAWLEVDLQQPFFLDHYQAGRGPLMYMYDAPPPAMNGIRNAWDRFRKEQAEAALQALYPRLANQPLLVQNETAFTPYASSPTAPEIARVVLPESETTFLPISTRRTLFRITPNQPVAFDATAIPVKRLKETLTRWQIGG